MAMVDVKVILTSDCPGRPSSNFFAQRQLQRLACAVLLTKRPIRPGRVSKMSDVGDVTSQHSHRRVTRQANRTFDALPGRQLRRIIGANLVNLARSRSPLISGMRRRRRKRSVGAALSRTLTPAPRHLITLYIYRYM